MAQRVKHLPAMRETPGSIPGLGRSPGEGSGNHSRILAWKIPWTEKPGRLQSTGSQSQTHLSNVHFHTVLQVALVVKNLPANAGDMKRGEVKSLSRVRLSATPWTAAYQAPQSMGFSRQEYRSGLPFPSPGDLP